MTKDAEPTQLSALLSDAVLRSLSASQQEELLKGSVAYLTTPGKGSYGDPKPAPLQSAFNQALDQAIRNVARDAAQVALNNNPAIRAQMQELLTAAFTRALETQREDTLNRLTNGIVAAMQGRDDD